MTHVDTGLKGAPPEPLDAAMIERYRRDGFLLLPPEYLTQTVFDTITAVVPQLLAEDSPRRILERDETTVRSVYGVHQTDSVMAALPRLHALLGAARQILGDDVYVHQSKINLKAPFAGDQWEWHQDYIYWLQSDGLRTPPTQWITSALRSRWVTSGGGMAGDGAEPTSAEGLRVSGGPNGVH